MPYTSEPLPSPDDAPCKCCRQMVYSTSKAMNCNWCHGWFHTECLHIDEDTFQVMESMRGSIWLCEGCEDAFGEIHLRVDRLAGENVELKASITKGLEALGRKVENLAKENAELKASGVRADQLAEENAELKAKVKELEELPGVVQSLKSQVETIEKELEFVLNDADSFSNTVVKTKSAAPTLKLTNRYEILAQFDQPAITPISESPIPLPPTYQHHSGVGIPNESVTPSQKGSTSPPLVANLTNVNPPRPNTSSVPTVSKIYPSLEETVTSGAERKRILSDSGNFPPSSSFCKFFIRGVPMGTALETVQSKLASYGIPPEQVNTLTLPASLTPSARRKYLEVSLTTSMANKLHVALKTEESLGWFISMLPPRVGNPRQAPPRVPPPAMNCAQPLSRNQHAGASSQPTTHQPSPPSNGMQVFQTASIPPLMSLNLGPGMSGGGAQTHHNC